MRVLVVDDSTVFRKVVRDALANDKSVEVVGVASDGEIALRKIAELEPDVVTLDIEMPKLDGIEVLRTLKTHSYRPAVVMLSALTKSGATATTQALRLGAFDFVLKPAKGSMQENCEQLRSDLIPKLESLKRRSKREVRRVPSSPRASQEQPAKSSKEKVKDYYARVVALGISTGGPAALAEMMARIPADIEAPILIVQHMPPLFTKSLADDLDRNCRISVCEATHGQRVEPGHAYIAPGGKQMRVAKKDHYEVIQITEDPPERNCKPSVDYLFRSVASVYGQDAMGVVMTGMGDDGTLGCRHLKRKGCTIVAQDEATSTVYGMPRSVVEEGLADIVSPLGEIHNVLRKAALNGASLCR